MRYFCIGINLDFYCQIRIVLNIFRIQSPWICSLKEEVKAFPLKHYLSAGGECHAPFFRSFTLLNLICAFTAQIPTFRGQICLLQLPAALEN